MYKISSTMSEFFHGSLGVQLKKIFAVGKLLYLKSLERQQITFRYFKL